VLYYVYDYAVAGEVTRLWETWVRMDENTYSYRVGIYKDGAWNDIYLDALFKRVTS
jgi:hypothetical protein